MRVPEFVLTEAYTWDEGPHDKRSLPAGAFIKPIESCYVPQHIRKRWDGYIKWADEEHIYAYGRYGFIVVPLNLLRPV